MSRVQLALNVTDLDAAVAHYGALFDAEPAKRRPGYANFAIADPPLKLVLIEGEGAGGTLNHLGVEVADSATVERAATRLRGTGMATDERHGETCCHATQDKVWVVDPDGARWEIYTVTDDAPAVPADATACC